MRFRHLLITLGAMALILKIFEDLTTEEEETRIGLKFDINPQGEGEDAQDLLLDRLGNMNEYEREEKLIGLAEKLHEGEAVPVPSNLTKRQAKILSLFEKKERIDTDMLAKKIKNVTVRTLRRDLDKLADQHLIEKIGKTKGVHYIKI